MSEPIDVPVRDGGIRLGQFLKLANAVDQTIHFLRPVTFDVLADARIVRIGRNTMFGQVSLTSAVDQRPVGMVSSAYAIG